MSRKRLWFSLLALTLVGCSDDSSEKKDGGKADGSVSDGTTGLPDGYGPLWPCEVPGQACNAHDPCAINATCGEDKLCRPAALQSCDDGLECTDDVCQGMGLCANQPKAGFCALPVQIGAATDGGVGTTEVRCFKKDDKDPSDTCQLCDPDKDPTKWSPANGGYCDDDNPCTKDDYCAEGQCKGTYYGDQCADEYGCTDDLCDGKGGCLGNELKTDWCLISGVCHKDGTMDPSGGCNVCDVSKSQSAWTPVSNTCTINGKCYKPGDQHPQGCATCDPATSTTQWTPTSTSCAIGYSCFTAGATEPGGCGICDATKNKTGWTKPASCPVVYSWAKSFGDTSSDYPYGVAVDSSGNVYIAGYFYKTIDFGGGPLTANGTSTDLYVASFTPDGTHRWSKVFGNTSSDYSYGIAVDKSDNVYITGYFYNSVDFGGGTLTSNGSGDIYIASFTSKGTHRWSKSFGSTSSDYGYGVTTDASGNVYITGYFYNTVDFGGGGLTSKGSYDAFVASFTSTGTHRWSKSYGGSSSDYGYDIAVDASSNVYVTGRFYNDVDFGGGTITNKGGGDLYIVSYTSTGTHRWSKGFGGTSSDYGYGIGVDGSGNVYVTGYYYNTVDFGGGQLTANGSYDMYIASFTSTGTYRWARSHGSTSSDLGRDVVVDASGNVYVAGYFYNTADFGGGEMTSNGSYDIFLLKLVP